MNRTGGYIGARPSWNNISNRNGIWRLNDVHKAITDGSGWWATTYMFSYTSTTITLGAGNYIIKMWGAGGGFASGGANGNYTGASGGALVKNVTLTGTETWNIYSGGGGNSAIGDADNKSSIQYGVGAGGDYPGGSGGGFYGTGYEQGIWCGGAGGGAAVLTGTTPGTLVAAGGGGAPGDGGGSAPTGGGTGNGAGGAAGSGGNAGSSGYGGSGYAGGGGGSNKAAQSAGNGGSGGQNVGSGATLYNGNSGVKTGILSPPLPGNSNDVSYIPGYGNGAGVSNGTVQTRGGHSLILIIKL